MSITFSYINHVEDASPITASSEETNFPVENLSNPFRSKPWRTQNGEIEDQYVIFDFGYQVTIKSFFMTNEQRGIQLSEQAVITVEGSDDGNWTTPQSSVSIDWHETLITKFHDTAFGRHRFFRVTIDDPNNIDNYLEVGNMYLGESLTFTTTDLNLGWGLKKIDDSDRVLSDGGEAWFDRKAQKDQYDFTLKYMSRDESRELLDMFYQVGQHKPFYIHLDPDLKISTDISELSIYCRFTSELKFTNPFLEAWDTSLTVEEVV